MSAPENQPAFPVHPGIVFEDGPETRYEGMSLRDWFAGQALAGILAAHKAGKLKSADAAFHAYAFADAMLAERSKATGAQS